MKHIVLATCILIIGCTSNTRFIDGTSVQLGAYVPWQSNLYGVEIISYVNGCTLSMSSNLNFKIEREFIATNDYLWGAMNTREHSKVKVDANK